MRWKACGSRSARSNSDISKTATSDPFSSSAIASATFSAVPISEPNRTTIRTSPLLPANFGKAILTHGFPVARSHQGIVLVEQGEVFAQHQGGGGGEARGQPPPHSRGAEPGGEGQHHRRGQADE